LFGILLFAENQAAARTPESLVSGGGDKVSMSNGTGMQTGRDEAGDVGDVGHEISADLPSNLAHPLKIDDARISARSDGDHARLVLARHLRQLVVIDSFIVFAHAVMNDFEKSARKVGFVAMRQVTAMAQIHRQHLVAGLKESEINRHVRSAA